MKYYDLIDALTFGVGLASYNYIRKIDKPPALFPLDIVLVISFVAYRSTKLKNYYKRISRKC